MNNCNNIFHAIGPQRNNKNCYNVLENTFLEVFSLCENIKASSIAMPLISSGKIKEF